MILGYLGLDGVVRRTLLRFSPQPSLLTTSTARLELSLQPQQEVTFYVTVGCERQPAIVRPLAFDDARTAAESDLERYSAWSCHLHTSNGEINAWVSRAVSDLHMMTTALATGPYPYAGLPWFNTPFGRDGIVTALECLWLRPGLARGVLAYLASTQATEVIPEQDAEPGKILHETRNGEMAVLKELPFGQYYGSADATLLFVLLAGAYYGRTGDRVFVESLWPHLEAALHWIDGYRDRDRDKRPCQVRTSNAGQCLFTGIVSPDRARRVARTLLSPESFSGWGIRTVAMSEVRYNPMAYHNGSVWPHDNGLLAQGLARYGMGELALRIWTGMFEAGRYFDLHRMPELFCGFPQAPGEGPTLYPVACAPQSWSVASVFLLFQACLGLEINGPEAQVYFTRPHLPASLGELRIHNLEVAGATVDLLLVRHEQDVGVNVLRRDGDVQILVVK